MKALAGALLALAALLLLACGGSDAGEEAGTAGDARDLLPFDAATAAIGAEVYAANCASCHGSNGEGQPNWKERLADGTLPAPPHDVTGHTWHHADGLLFRIIRDGCAAYAGGPSCRMPSFDATLSDVEIVAVIEHLRSWWGPEERAFQSEVSAQDPFPER